MNPAATRFLLLGAAALYAAAWTRAENPAVVRTPPSRPAALAVTRLNGADHVDVTDAAARLGLKAVWTEPAHRLVLSDRANRVELEAEGREIAVNGLRVFLGSPALLRGGELYVSRIDFERCLTPLLRPGLGLAPLPPPKIIALDPGHGGSDNGTQNQNPRIGLMEKTATLDVALRLKKILEAGGYRVVLTRTDDRQLAPEKQVDLSLRAEVANRAGADLFVSLHFNSLYPDTRTSGTEIYTFAPQYQRSANSWGMHRDDAETEAAPVNRFDAWSVVLAQAIHRNLLGALKTLDRGKKINQLGVLRRLNCPAVLVEAAFLSNDDEARRVATPEFREAIAEAVAAGIRDYAATLDRLRRPPGPPPSP